jgi:acetoin utilization deacetylase AcuC-like enzyme
MKVGYVYDPIYLQHDTGYHVESPSRLTAIMNYLDKTGALTELIEVKPRAATTDELAAVHDRQYITYVEYVARKGGAWVDADTILSSKSFDAAVFAAGGIIRAVETVMDGQLDSCFGLVRPPGHHATSDRSMGFCIFNNIAIAAKYALARYNLEHIAIIDFDVHQGNGTQEAFYDNPHVMYVSTHQFPYYPGTGRVEETGTGEGKGNILNIPLAAGCGDAEYLQVFREVIVPKVRQYKPQLVMVSAGYDIHWIDELAQMQVTTTGIAEMVRMIKGLAEEFCSGRMVIALEGGYHLEALSTSVKATFDVLLGKPRIEDILGPPKKRVSNPDVLGLIRQLKEVHHLDQ